MKAGSEVKDEAAGSAGLAAPIGPITGECDPADVLIEIGCAEGILPLRPVVLSREQAETEAFFSDIEESVSTGRVRVAASPRPAPRQVETELSFDCFVEARAPMATSALAAAPVASAPVPATTYAYPRRELGADWRERQEKANPISSAVFALCAFASGLVACLAFLGFGLTWLGN